MQFNKLALAAAVAAAPTAGVAMEPMKDGQLADVTGQDGVSISLTNVNLAMDVGIEDTDGVATGGSTYASPGLLLMDGQRVFNVTSGINIEMDVGDTTTTVDNSAMLEVRVNIPTLTLDTGDIYAVEGTAGGTTGTPVADGIANVTSQAAAVTTGSAIIPATNITLSNLDLTVQLGEEEDSFLNINSTSTVTVAFGSATDTTSNFSINDANGSQISMGEQSIRNITFGSQGIDGNVVDAGLQLTIGTDAMTNVDIAMMDVTLGNPGATTTDNNSGELGNVYVTGLDLSGTNITIGGH